LYLILKYLDQKGLNANREVSSFLKCRYENFELEKDNIAGGRIKATKLPLTKLWEAEAIGSIPKISNYQKTIRKVYFRKSAALSFYGTTIFVES